MCKEREALTVTQLVALVPMLAVPKEYSLEHLVSQDVSRYSTKKVFLYQVSLEKVGVK